MKIWGKRSSEDVPVVKVTVSEKVRPADWKAFKAEILEEKRHGRIRGGSSEWLGPTAVVVPRMGRPKPILEASESDIDSLGLSDAESRVAVKLGIYSVSATRAAKPVLEVDEVRVEPSGHETKADIDAQFSLLRKLAQTVPLDSPRAP